MVFHYIYLYEDNIYFAVNEISCYRKMIEELFLDTLVTIAELRHIVFL